MKGEVKRMYLSHEIDEMSVYLRFLFCLIIIFLHMSSKLNNRRFNFRSICLFLQSSFTLYESVRTAITVTDFLLRL
jgi:hypothetical protein